MIDFKKVKDEDLYGMCLIRDEDAWQYVYNCILTICKWRKWKLRDQPEEICQSILVHLFDKAFKKIKEKDKFRVFVKVTAINKIKDSFKSLELRHEPLEKKVRNPKGEDFTPEYPDDKPSQETLIFRCQVASIIDSAIEKLPSLCRKIVKEYLNFKIGLYKSYAELSGILKMPIPTISSKVSRCLPILVENKEIKDLHKYAF